MAGEYRWHLIPDIINKQRAALIELMGGTCISCGSSEDLEFHHPNGKNWRSKDLSQFQRMRKYEEDASNGELELLCDACHNNPNDHPDTCFCPHCIGEDF